MYSYWSSGRLGDRCGCGVDLAGEQASVIPGRPTLCVGCAVRAGRTLDLAKAPEPSPQLELVPA